MKIHLLFLAATCLVAGCTTPDRPPETVSGAGPLRVAEERAANLTPLRVTGGPTAETDRADAEFLVAKSPSPELARAVQRGEARPAGPVTDERFQRWYAAADLRVRLEVRLGQQSHLHNLLQLAEKSEDRFVERFGIGKVGPGESADLQLRMFQVVRDRLRQELITTDGEIDTLRRQIARIETQGGKTIHIGDRTMSKPLAECGFSAAQITKLEGLGIKNARDFALQFYLPEQHEAAAGLLEVELAEAQRLVGEAAEELSEEDLNELVREARRPHKFGILPPDIDDEETRQ